jgi:antitoxin CcdA
MRQATNLTLPKDLIAEARALDVNISRACEAGLAREVKAAREAQWKRDHADKIEAWNRWIDINGLPLAKYRMF